MRWGLLVAASLAAILIGAAGCQSQGPIPRDQSELGMFGPASMRIHPIFTQIKSWNGQTTPDGVDAEIEFQDQFGDPTKAAGKILFELYAYQPQEPDPRGSRVCDPWVASIVDADQQSAHWNRTSRTYSFQLHCPGISFKKSYVLYATFEHTGGRRFFDHLILQPQIQPSEN